MSNKRRIGLLTFLAAGVILASVAAVRGLRKPPPLPPLTSQERLNKSLIDAVHGEWKEGVRAALKAGADPNARGYWDPRGFWDKRRHQRVWEPGSSPDRPTALMLASYFDSTGDLVELLVRAGANVNALDDGGNTALTCAMGQKEASLILLDHGATVQPNKEGEDPLVYAVYPGSEEVARRLIERGARVNHRYEGGYTPLHRAAMASAASMIRVLLEHGADVNAISDEGDTPLHLLVQSGATEGHGIRIDPQERIDSIRVLLEHHPDLNTWNRQGKTALQIAKDRSFPDIVRLLTEAGAKE